MTKKSLTILCASSCRAASIASGLRDGRDALDHLPEYRPDVILLDLAMPDMNGFAFLNCLRQDISSAELPVIVLTSSILDPQERSSLNSTSMILFQVRARV